VVVTRAAILLPTLALIACANRSPSTQAIEQVDELDQAVEAFLLEHERFEREWCQCYWPNPSTCAVFRDIREDVARELRSAPSEVRSDLARFARCQADGFREIANCTRACPAFSGDERCVSMMEALDTTCAELVSTETIQFFQDSR